MKAGRGYVSLSTQDPVQMLTESFFSALACVGNKLSTALREGKKLDCEKDFNSLATTLMTTFQGLVQDRVRFNELLSVGQEVTSAGTLKERCKFLENETLVLLRRTEELQRELAEVKLQSGKTVYLLAENASLRHKVDNMSLRIDKLSAYSSTSVEELLNTPDTDLVLPCTCGGQLLDASKSLLDQMRKEMINYKQTYSVAPVHKENGNGAFREENLEKELKMRELQEKVYSVNEELVKAKLSKEMLDSRFLESAVLEDLIRQLGEVVGHCLFLKTSLDKAEKKVADIQVRRTAELNEIFDKTNEDKMKLVQEISQLNRELSVYKVENIKLQKRYDEKVNTEAQTDPQNREQQNSLIASLTSQVARLSTELAAEKEKVRHEHHRVYKYEKELQNVKDQHYNELLNRYAKCESVSLRHSRHEEVLRKLFEANKTGGLGVESELEELTQYVKGREEKVSHLENKWKKTEKEFDGERKQCQSYIKALEEATSAYSLLCADNSQLKKEVADLNTNFSKVCKDKALEKQTFDHEIGKLKNEVRNLKETVPALKGAVAELSKTMTIKDKHLVREA